MLRFVIVLLFVASCAAGQSTIAPPVANFPALNVQVAVAILAHNKKLGFAANVKTMTIHPTVMIEGVARLTAIPAAESIMLTVTVNEYKAENVLSFEKQTIPESKSGDRRQFSYAESYFDSNGKFGPSYAYYIFALRDPATKEIIEFKTSNSKLLSFCKDHPERRDVLLDLSAGAEIPPMK